MYGSMSLELYLKILHVSVYTRLCGCTVSLCLCIFKCIYFMVAVCIIHFQTQHAFIFITFCSITILMGLSMGKDKRSIFNVYLTVANFT